jgi:hypothetical protein
MLTKTIVIRRFHAENSTIFRTLPLRKRAVEGYNLHHDLKPLPGLKHFGPPVAFDS